MKKLLILLVTFTLGQANDTIQVPDFILDYSSLKNTKVCVAGDIRSMGDITMLADRNNPMASIFLDTSRLSRDLRKQIMQQCGMMDTCSSIVCGKASDIMFNKGLIAEKIK